MKKVKNYAKLVFAALGATIFCITIFTIFRVLINPGTGSVQNFLNEVIHGIASTLYTSKLFLLVFVLVLVLFIVLNRYFIKKKSLQ